MFVKFGTWLRQVRKHLLGGQTRPRAKQPKAKGGRRRCQPFRPCVEAFEERLVPSTLTVISPLDPATLTAGTLRYLLGDCYRDVDLGPILRSDDFREFRERFPEPKTAPSRNMDFD